MKTLWKVTKGIFTITGAYAWIKAILDTVLESGKEPEPIVHLVMFQNSKSK